MSRHPAGMSDGDWDEAAERFYATPLIHAHSHQWIDPLDSPIARATYSPIIGDKRREMKPGRTYHCRECSALVVVPPRQVTP